MPLASSSYAPVNSSADGMRLPSLPSINTFLAMSNVPPSNPSRNYTSSQEEGFIDLTVDSSSPPRPTSFSASPISDSEYLAFLRAETTTPQTTGESASMSQRITSTLQEPSPRKRRRLDSLHSSPGRHISSSHRPRIRQDSEFIDVDSLSNGPVLDLTEVEGREALYKVQEEQRERHLALQEQQNQLVKESVRAQEPETKGPFRLGQIQCVICMDSMTDLTATHCGI